MKALVIEALGRSRLREVDDPGAPGPGELLIDIRRIGLCGSDLATFTGLNPLVSLPRIPGHEIGAEILAVGSGVDPALVPGIRGTVIPYTSCGECTSCRIGRTNACRYNRTLGVQQDGALAERVLVPASKFLPEEHVDPALLPLIEPLSVGFHAVMRGRVAQGDRVVVLGCGMIGMGVVAAAAARGAEVIAIDIGDKARRALALGAIHAVDTAKATEAVLDLTGGDGADVVFEAVGLPETFVQSVDLVAFGGRVVYIGYTKRLVTYDASMFNLKELDIRGSRNAMASDFKSVIAYMGETKVNLGMLVTQRFSFAEADQALPFWVAHRDSTLKIMVER